MPGKPKGAAIVAHAITRGPCMDRAEHMAGPSFLRDCRSFIERTSQSPAGVKTRVNPRRKSPLSDEASHAHLPRCYLPR